MLSLSLSPFLKITPFVATRASVIAIVKMTVTAVLDQFYAPSVLTVCNEALAPATTAPEVHPMRFSRTRRPFVRHSHVMARGT